MEVLIIENNLKSINIYIYISKTCKIVGPSKLMWQNMKRLTKSQMLLVL